MRELSEKEMGMIAGGYPQITPAVQPSRNLALPLTVTFGTPVEPWYSVPGLSPS